jgi:hypothetical protein
MSPDYTKCLEDLVDTMLRNIEYWGHEEDGIHEKLWPSYVQAKAAIQGIFVTDGDEGGYN